MYTTSHQLRLKELYSDALSARICNPNETVLPFALNRSTLPYNVTEFNVFVAEKDIMVK